MSRIVSSGIMVAGAALLMGRIVAVRPGQGAGLEDTGTTGTLVNYDGQPVTVPLR